MNIFEYSEYREYLKDFYAKAKAANSSFSYRVFARSAGFKSPSFIPLVIQHKANLSVEGAEKLADGMQLPSPAKKYFCLLVRLDQCQSDDEKQEIYAKILNIKAFQKYHPLTKAQHLYLSKWHYAAIKELITLKTFQENPTWINRVLKSNLSNLDIENAIKDLIVLGLIKRDANSQLQIVENAVITTDQISSVFLKSYHQQFINLAVASMDKFDENLREIHGITLPVSAKMVEVYKQMLLKFREDILALAENDKNFVSVYQFNLNFFPLAIVDSEDSKG